jgi:hypothetical protein
MNAPERRVWGERRPKEDMMTLPIILVFTLALTCPKHLHRVV